MSRFGPPTCPVCWGRECWGGSNKTCAQRDPKPSRIGGILDTYGGLRAVVTHKDKFKHHVRPDEVLILVPGVRLHEPIPWGLHPKIKDAVEAEVEKWIDRGPPNEPHARQAATMYRLRGLEHNGRGPRRTLNLYDIVET